MPGPLPTRSVRIDPQHVDVLNTVLAMVRAGQAEDVRVALSKLGGVDQPIGVFRSADAALDFLVGRIVVIAHPLAIWLFGSRARGDFRPSSDFDLLVVFDDADTAQNEKLERLAGIAAATGVGVDVVGCTASELEAYGDTVGSLVKAVRADGREVYVSPAERRRRKGSENGRGSC